MAKVLVTGYGGFLGGEITRQLLAAGHRVRGLARGEYPELVSAGVESVRGDLRRRASVMQAVAGTDAIVHTAAKAGVWGRWGEFYASNTLATSHVLEAAHRHTVKALVYTSSPSVTFSGRPQSGVDESEPYSDRWLCFYPQTKALAEAAVLEASRQGRLRCCALRPHLIWGWGDPHLFPRVVERALAGSLRRVGSGDNLIDVVHVRNAARAHVQALERLLEDDPAVNGQAMFLSDGQPIGCWEWITRILEQAELSPPTRSISFPMAYRLGGMLETIYWTLRRQSEPPMTRFVAAQLALDHYFSIVKARQLLGYDPVIDREAELTACGEWLRGLKVGHQSR